MKQSLLTGLLAFFCLGSYAQVEFENGYLIKKNGEKETVQIKNIGWKNNPTTFTYKMSEDSETQTALFGSVVEFGIENQFKYILKDVQIDRSRSKLVHYSENSQPEFVEEQLFLKVLVEGKASLYQYEEENIIYFFYSMDNSTIEPLIYKTYTFDSPKMLKHDEIRENNRYKQQLLNDLNCESLSIRDFENLEYKKGSLTDVFVAYNECNSNDFVDYTLNDRVEFNLHIRPGVEFSSLSISNEVTDRAADLGNQTSLRFGVEAEFILPFNKKKWAIIFEPNYKSFKGEKEVEETNTPYSYKYEVDLKLLELPLGARYYMFLNKNSKIFIDATASLHYSIGSEAGYTRRDEWTELEIDPRPVTIGLGVGYQLNNRYSLSAKYRTNLNPLSGYAFMDADYTAISIILGYRIL